MPLTDLTTAQIAVSTKKQVATNVKAQIDKMSKTELVELVLGTLTVSDTPVCVYRKEDGQIESQVEVFRDAETGARVGGCITTWTYYEKSGCVDEITISQRDAGDREIERRVIKHFEDGRQPTVTK